MRHDGAANAASACGAPCTRECDTEIQATHPPCPAPKVKFLACCIPACGHELKRDAAKHVDFIFSFALWHKDAILASGSLGAGRVFS